MSCPFCAANLPHPTGPTSPPDPLVAARERLGAWLSAEDYRTWQASKRPEGSLHAPWLVLLQTCAGGNPFLIQASGEGPDLASAIVAALEKANT